MNKKNCALPPAVVTYMSYSGLGIVRALGRHGIPVYALSPDPKDIGMDSRFCISEICPAVETDEEKHIEYLINLSKKIGQKPVLFPTGDNTVICYAKYEKILRDYFLFTGPEHSIIDKLVTKGEFYKTGIECKVPSPQTYIPKSLAEVNSISLKIPYPCIIKPIYSHSWHQESIENILGSGIKVIVSNTPAELLSSYKNIAVYDPNVIISEIIPGDDSELFYFVFYISNDYKVLGHFAGRKLRITPAHFGSASFVESIYDKDLEEVSVNFLKNLKYKGLGGIEFKRDSRDGKFKLIEFNARFGLWDMLGARCGVDIAYIAYADIIGKEITRNTNYRTGVKWASIYRDTGAFIGYKKEGLITFWKWLRSLCGKVQWAVFAWDDIRPSFSLSMRFLQHKIGRECVKLTGLCSRLIRKIIKNN